MMSKAETVEHDKCELRAAQRFKVSMRYNREWRTRDDTKAKKTKLATEDESNSRAWCHELRVQLRQSRIPA